LFQQKRREFYASFNFA